MVIVLHPTRPFTILVKQGQVMFHNIGKQDFSLASMVSIPSVKSGYLTIDSDKKEIKMTKFAFDHKKMPRLSDGFLLMTMKKFQDKGIKKITLFRPNLVMETHA